MSPSGPVELSVIVTTYNAAGTIERCLESICAQRTGHRYEVIVVDSGQDDTARLVRKGFPDVRLLQFATRKYCGSARNLGLAQACGSLVAFTDADCIVADDWIDRIVEAHHSEHLAIGGSIGNGPSRRLTAWAAYFCEFSQWTPGLPARPINDVAGANMSYKHEAFQRFGPFLENTYCSDTEFHWRLARGGHRIRFEPAIRVEHHSIDDWRRFARHEFAHGRWFGQVRRRVQKFPLWRRAAYVAVGWLIPPVLLCRIVSYQLRSRRYVRWLLPAGPLLLLGLAAWACGECVGYLKGRIDEPCATEPVEPVFPQTDDHL